jgi:alkylhydroperoxidase/carboxymuconolactone decarboxylase family protein YurZ
MSCKIRQSALPRFLAIVLTCTTCCRALGQTSPISTIANPAPSAQEILRELATTQRLLADELFISGDRNRAKVLYSDARATASKLTTAGGLFSASAIRLLQDEIDYRQFLLERNASVWGLRFSSRPVNPIGAVSRFQDTFGRFSKAVQEVGSLTDRLKDKNATVFRLEDKSINAERDTRIAEMKQGISEVRLRDANLRRAIFNDRKEAIQARQAQLAAEISALQKTIDDRSAGINTTLTKAIAQYVGLPPDTASLMQGSSKNDLNAAISAAVQRYAHPSDLASGVPAQLKSLAQTVQDTARKYEELRKSVSDAKEQAQKGAALLRAIQAHDRNTLIAIGSEVISGLNPDTRDKLMAAIGTVRDVDAAMRLAGTGTAVRGELANFIKQLPDITPRIGTSLAAYLKDSDNLALRYQQLLTAANAAATTAEQQTAVLGAFAHGWSRSFVADVIGSRAAGPLARQMGSKCTAYLECSDWLVDRFKRGSLDGVPLRVSAAGQITLTANGTTIALFAIADVINITANRSLESSDAIKPDIDALMKRLQSGESQLVGEAVRRLPDIDFDTDVAEILSTMLSKEQQAALLRRLSSGGSGTQDPAPARKDLAAFAVGRDIAQQTVYNPPSAPNTTKGQTPAQGVVANAVDPAQTAILAAMKASGPYGFAAATAIEIFSSIVQSAADAALINAKAREDRDLTTEMLHIAAFELEMQRDEAIASLELRIATQQFETAGRRADLYQQALLDRGEQLSAIQAQIRRRLPLIYLLAEQLRERFDAVDHAVAFWANDFDPEHRFVERTLRSDPQWRRFGLDPDISLYDWFTREDEGQRNDLDQLLTHWRGIEDLVQNVCQEYHCLPTDSQMGQVEMTDLISVKELVGDDAWRKAESSRTLPFTLLPQSLPYIPKRQGLRLVDVYGGVFANGASSATVNPNVVLRHSGLGYVFAGAAGVRDTLEASNDRTPRLPVDDVGASNVLTALQSRWTPAVSLLPLEGYPLFGLYHITFPPSFDFKSSDLKLRFYYQVPANSASFSNQLSDAQFLCRFDNRKQTAVPASDVQLLVVTNPDGMPTLNAPSSCAVLAPQSP